MRPDQPINVHIVNAFVDGEFGGNPAGVVLKADNLSHLEKQTIAQAIGLSETAFVSRSEVATFKLDFFTPSRQIPHCGHATIAVFSLLRQLGHLTPGEYSKETIDGTRRILIEADMAFMEQTAPQTRVLTPDMPLHSATLQALNLKAAQLIPDMPPAVVNTGNGFLLVGLQRAEDLAQLQPNLPLIQDISEELDLVGFYAFVQTASQADRVVSTRMFAPLFGIPEEAATGMAAGPMACYLWEAGRAPADRLLIEQGRFMQPPSPSLITVQLQTLGKNIQSLMAGGSARVTKQLTLPLRLPLPLPLPR